MCVRRMKAFPILLPHHRSNTIVGTRRTTHRPACNSLRECVDHEHNVQPQRWHVEIPALLAAYNCQLACHPLSVSGHERIFTSRAMAARRYSPGASSPSGVRVRHWKLCSERYSLGRRDQTLISCSNGSPRREACRGKWMGVDVADVQPESLLRAP